MVVGLTGGAASGKTLVSDELRRLGAYVVDADLVSREIYTPGGPVYNEVVRVFGKGVLDKDGSINRDALGRVIFSDPEKRLSLNSITHPVIIRIIRERVRELKERHPGSLIVIDAALLIEAGMRGEVEKVVVVYAEEKKQVERLMKKYRISGEEAQSRVSAQMPLEEKKRYADHVIDNNGTMEEAISRARVLYGILSRA